MTTGDGQANPLTIVNLSHSGIQKFHSEMGARRYWATWLLNDFIPGYQGGDMIPYIIIPNEKESPFLQGKENITWPELNAVAMVRQIALLLLYIHDVPMPVGPVAMYFKCWTCICVDGMWQQLSKNHTLMGNEVRKRTIQAIEEALQFITALVTTGFSIAHQSTANKVLPH